MTKSIFVLLVVFSAIFVVGNCHRYNIRRKRQANNDTSTEIKVPVLIDPFMIIHEEHMERDYGEYDILKLIYKHICDYV